LSKLVESLATSFSSRARLSTGAGAAFSGAAAVLEAAGFGAAGLGAAGLVVAGLEAAGLVSAANAGTANRIMRPKVAGTAARSFTDGAPPLGVIRKRRRILPCPRDRQPT